MHQALISIDAPRGAVEEWIQRYRNDETEHSVDGFVNWLSDSEDVEAEIIEPEPLLF